MANVLSFVALALSGVSVLFALLALALPYWESNAFSHVGLFRLCIKHGGGCADTIDLVVGETKDALRATQAMVILGFFASVGSLVVLVIAVFVKKDMKPLGYVAGALSFAGGFLLMIGMGIYADKISVNNDYGSGFAFDVLGWLVGWATAGLIFFITIRGGGEAATS